MVHWIGTINQSKHPDHFWKYSGKMHKTIEQQQLYKYSWNKRSNALREQTFEKSMGLSLCPSSGHRDNIAIQKTMRPDHQGMPCQTLRWYNYRNRWSFSRARKANHDHLNRTNNRWIVRIFNRLTGEYLVFFRVYYATLFVVFNSASIAKTFFALYIRCYFHEFILICMFSDSMSWLRERRLYW